MLFHRILVFGTAKSGSYVCFPIYLCADFKRALAMKSRSAANSSYGSGQAQPEDLGPTISVVCRRLELEVLEI